MAEFLKFVGVLCWVIGAWLIYSGVVIEVTVDPDGTGPVANLQLMHIQQLNVLLGALAMIHGAICLVGGCVMAMLAARPKPSD